MRIVLDTNCLLVVLPARSQYRCLWEAIELDFLSELVEDYENKFYPVMQPAISEKSECEPAEAV